MADERSGVRGRGKRGKRGHRGHAGHRGKRGHRGHRGHRGPAGPSSSPPIIAAGAVNENGQFISSRGFVGLPVFTAPNRIDLTLATPPPNIFNAIGIATILSSNAEVSVLFSPPNQLSVFTWTSLGLPDVFPFNIVVYDNTP